MSDFKFGCPVCGQHIKADLAATGRQVNCPSCDARLLIPAPASNPTEFPSAILIGARKSFAAAPVAATGGSSSTVAPTPRPTQAPAQPAAAAITPALKPAPTPAPAGDKAARPDAPPKPVAPAMVAPAAAPVPKLKVAIPTPAPPTAAPSPREEKPAPVAAPAAAPSIATSVTPPAPPPVAESPVAAADPAKVQVAVLSSALKREIVRAVRARLTDESRWMPRKTESGKFSYAAKRVGGELIPVPITSPEATHFSLLGAVLLEFHQRNVTQTASGRKEFLDGEIVAAIREVTRQSGAASAGALSSTGESLDPMAMTHAQCLQALDLLDRRYVGESEAIATAEAERKLEPVRLSDLVRKLELQGPVTAEEVATALYHELEEINRRLAALERVAGQAT